MASVFGLDIGGSGIKGAPVDLERGELAAERVRLLTPEGARVDDVAATVAQVVDGFGFKGLVGATFPAVIVNGVARTAANVDKGWIDTDVAATLSASTGCHVVAVNDADAAGLAEMRFGVGRDVKGTVALLTFGTGIGSALFLDGKLVPNTELGHLEIDGSDAETKTADAAREREDLTWEHWAHRLSKYLKHFEALLWPDLIILGGGVSKKAEKFLPFVVDVRTKVVTAQLQNGAGIIGAALYAAELYPAEAERTASG
jgi:polyphosphate glucokinase